VDKSRCRSVSTDDEAKVMATFVLPIPKNMSGVGVQLYSRHGNMEAAGRSVVKAVARQPSAKKRWYTTQSILRYY